jgi:hypothetical protein
VWLVDVDKVEGEAGRLPLYVQGTLENQTLGLDAQLGLSGLARRPALVLARSSLLRTTKCCWCSCSAAYNILRI